MDQTVEEWFCLLNSKGIGPKTFWSLIRKYGNAARALRYIKEPFPLNECKRIISSFEGKIILACDKGFPEDLKQFDGCPPILFYKGDISLLSERRIAIIGARNASINGRTMAKLLAERLGEQFSVISGLAKGIDAVVHQAVLNANGKTIAILPFDLNNIYPKENEALSREIGCRGLLLSEVLPNRVPDQGMFLARNRLIASLAEGIVIIEAALRSGTLSTAQFALELGKEIMVIPGSPLDPRYSGSNMLIKNGASLIEGDLDVFDILNGNFHYIQEKALNLSELSDKHPLELSKNGRKEMVLSLLSTTPINIDEIARYLKISTREVLGIISLLEIEQRVAKNSNNEVFLKVSM